MTEKAAIGQQTPFDGNSLFNALSFLIDQTLGAVRTCVMVQVTGVTNHGELEPVGFLDAQPMVNQLDGAGNATPHGTLYGLCYVRVQGGKNAVICDPEVGDIGIAVIADRDCSAVKNAKKVSNPGTFRRFDMADGIFIGGCINETPEQYVQFTPTGMKLADKNGNAIEMKPGAIEVTTAEFRVNGKVFAGYGTGDQIGLQTHEHPTAGNGPPSPPTAGT